MLVYLLIINNSLVRVQARHDELQRNDDSTFIRQLVVLDE